MKIYFVRHAQTTANKEQKIEGHTQGEITPEGRKQARTTAQQLASINFEAAYTSDLTRCTQTTNILLEEHTIQATKDSRLRGRNYGSYEGKPVGSIDWKEEGKTFEHENNYTQRVQEIIKEIVSQHTGNVLIVTHGGVIRRTLHNYCKYEQEKAMSKDIPNAQTLIVDFETNTCQIP